MDSTRIVNSFKMIDNNIDVPTWAWWSHLLTFVLGFLGAKFMIRKEFKDFLQMVNKVQQHNVLIEKDRDKYQKLSESQDKLLKEFKKQLTKTIKEKELAEERASYYEKEHTVQKEYILKLYLALVQGGVKVPQPAWLEEKDKK